MSAFFRKELSLQKRLTDRFVRTVKPTATQADYWDQTLIGFGLRGASIRFAALLPLHYLTDTVGLWTDRTGPENCSSAHVGD